MCARSTVRPVDTQTRVGIRIGPIMISKGVGWGTVLALVAIAAAIMAALNWQTVLGALAATLVALAVLYVLLRWLVRRTWQPPG